MLCRNASLPFAKHSAIGRSSECNYLPSRLFEGHCRSVAGGSPRAVLCRADCCTASRTNWIICPPPPPCRSPSAVRRWLQPGLISGMKMACALPRDERRVACCSPHARTQPFAVVRGRPAAACVIPAMMTMFSTERFDGSSVQLTVLHAS